MKHWILKREDDNVWLILDKQDSLVNTLDHAVLDEFNTLLDQLAEDPDCQGVIITSGKDTGFIAGAEISQFSNIQTAEDAKALIDYGQATFNKLATLKQPTVALIRGYCLGGGLELALACRYRIVCDDSQTRLGLPEVKLGIHPGWGGTVRLPQLIGPVAALDLMLTGRMVRAKVAYTMGLVDALVPERLFNASAARLLAKPPKRKGLGLIPRALNLSFIRPLVAMFLEKKLSTKVRQDHYPSPYAILTLWKTYGGHDPVGYEAEAQSILRLLEHDTAKQLLHVYDLQEQLKALSKTTDFDPVHVHVIGAGVMGGDIASWCVLQGLTVTLQDQNPKILAKAYERAFTLFKKRLKHEVPIKEALERFILDHQGLGLGKADVIIEAIFENVEAKQTLFKAIETAAKSTAVLATNTSSIPLDEIATVLQNPDRLVGIHFFNPVAKMPLVEVVRGAQTDPEIVARAMAFVGKLQRFPLPVNSLPGFLVNRILMPYLMECVALLDEGVDPVRIDEAATRFGMPMGPVELADTVGLDICLSVAKNLSTHFNTPIPETLIKKVEAGELGRKSGQGFYAYREGKPVKVAKEGGTVLNPQVITQRLVLRMINEAAACLRESVVDSPDLLDAGLIFGTGFAPFRGGLTTYVKTFEPEALREQFTYFVSEFGDRFTPDPGLEQLTGS